MTTATPQPKLAILSPLGRNPERGHGGITPVISALAGGLVDQGIQVELLLFAPLAGEQQARNLCPGCQIVNFGRGSRWQLLRGLLGYLDRQRPTALLGAGQRANLVLAWARRLRPSLATRIWAGVHNTLSQGGGRTTLSALLQRQWIGLAFRGLDGIIAVSQGVADDLTGYFRLPSRQVVVIHNPIVRPELYQKAREPLALPWQEQDLPLILGVGRLEQQKDFRTLIAAFALVRRERACRLAILGEGKLREELEAQIRAAGLEGEVILPGFVSNPFPWMARADAFALSSRWEGFGNVLVEAMALGTPVVSTDCPSGPREILDGGHHGPLVPVNDPRALADALNGLLDSPPSRQRLTAGAERFSAEASCRRYREVLLGDRLP